MDIFLSDKAFIGIVLSAIEVYKYECLGALLVGHRKSAMSLVDKDFISLEANFPANCPVKNVLEE